MSLTVLGYLRATQIGGSIWTFLIWCFCAYPLSGIAAWPVSLDGSANMLVWKRMGGLGPLAIGLSGTGLAGTNVPPALLGHQYLIGARVYYLALINLLLLFAAHLCWFSVPQQKAHGE